MHIGATLVIVAMAVFSKRTMSCVVCNGCRDMDNEVVSVVRAHRLCQWRAATQLLFSFSW